MTITLSRPSTPSISASSWGTIVVSTSLDMPVPRVRNSASISSKKITTGWSAAAFSRARSNTRRIDRSVSPTYLFSSSGPLTLRKAEFASASSTLTPRTSALRSTSSCATALAIMVLPQPGGP